jgi:23S rRNA pseudouridine2605 synthase
MTEERLHKVLAAAGIASRRACEKMISAGRVRVDGRVVTDLGTKVNAAIAAIAVDGEPVQFSKNNVYYRVYKPRGILSDIGGDSRGRETVAKLLPPGVGRVFPVGRLDLNSEGLVLLTDDGELTHRLTHPRFEHPKTYYVLAARRPTTEALIRLREGVELESGRTAPARVEVAERLPARLILDKSKPEQAAWAADVWKSSLSEKGVWLRFVLREGKKRQIRHMTAAVGIQLRRLIRWSIGPLTLDGLQPGMARALTPGEVYALRAVVDGRSGRVGPKSQPERQRFDRRSARRSRR